MARSSLAIVAILLFAALLRGLFIAEWADSPLSLPVIDALEYETEALSILNGRPTPQIYWHAPLYPYFVAAVYRTGSWDPERVMVAQMLLGLVTVFATWRIARRLLSDRWALVPPLLLAVHAPLIYFEGQLLRPTLFTTLLTLWFWLFLRVWERPSIVGWIGSGALLALAATCRESGLILVPLAAITAAFVVRSRRRAWVHAAMVVVGAAAVVLPVAVRNHQVGDEWVLLSSSGGINFHIGNAPAEERLVAVRPGKEWSDLLARARREGGALTPGARSRFYYGEGIDFWLEHPVEAVRHTMSKTIGAVSAHELPRNQDLYESRSESVVMRLLLWQAGPFAFPFGLLGPLALWGLGVAWRRGAHGRWLVLAFGLFMVGLIAFFPSARYRLPMIPLMAIFAAAALPALIDALRRRRWKPVAVLLLCTLFVNGGWARAVPDPADGHFMRGWTYLARNRPHDAEAAFEAALAVDPKHGEALTNLSAVLGARGELDQAAKIARRAVRGDSTNAHGWLNYGTALAGLGRFEEAEAAFIEAVRVQPDLDAGWTALRSTLDRRGAARDALPLLEAAVERWPADPGSWLRLADWHRSVGDVAEEEAVLRRAAERHPSVGMISERLK